jgi:MFS family permease
VFIALTDNFNLMIAARVLQAMGGGATVPAAIAIIADTFPGNKRPVAFGIIGGSVELGAAVGPSFGGAVSEYMGWRWVFWIDVIIGAIVIIMIYLMIRNTPGIRRRIDYLGALFIAIALSLLSLGLSQQYHRPNAELYMALYLIGSALFWYLSVRRLSRTPDPIFRLSMFRHTVFSSANITHLFIGGSLIIALVIVPVMGYTLMELSDVEVGLRLLRLTLAIPIGAVLGGFICHRFGYRIPTISGLILSSIGLFLMNGWTSDIIDPWHTVHLVICGFGFGLIISPITTAALDSVSREERGTASALVTWMRMAGMVIGLSVMNSWGMGHFHVQSAAISVDEIEDKLHPLALSIYQDFFLAAAIVCMVAIIPAMWMKNKNRD